MALSLPTAIAIMADRLSDARVDAALAARFGLDASEYQRAARIRRRRRLALERLLGAIPTERNPYSDGGGR